MERIIFLDRDSIQADIRRPGFPHEWRDFPATAAAQVSERLHGATIAISNKVPLMAASLTPLKHLKMIAGEVDSSITLDEENGVKLGLITPSS